MVNELLEDELELIVNGSVETLDDNLKAIILFGSGNNTDFIEGLSDLDFMYIMGNLNYLELGKIKDIRNWAHNETGRKVDIKPFSLAEFNAGIEGKGTFEFFTGWGLEMIRQGKQRCLYNSGDVPLDYVVDEKRIKADAFERAHYYITKLRKHYSSNEPVILRGEVKESDQMDRLKLTGSAIKNILTFCLASEGIFLDGVNKVLEQSEKRYGKLGIFHRLFKLKSDKQYDSNVLIESYNKIEEIYQRTLTGK